MHVLSALPQSYAWYVQQEQLSHRSTGATLCIASYTLEGFNVNTLRLQTGYVVYTF